MTFGEWRHAMAVVWTYAPSLQFMATQGRATSAFGGQYKWAGRPDNDNDIRA